MFQTNHYYNRFNFNNNFDVFILESFSSMHEGSDMEIDTEDGEIKNEETGLSIMLSDLEEKLQRQLHYYFSEENYSKDQFLHTITDEFGYVPLSKIFEFKKMSMLFDRNESLIKKLEVTSNACRNSLIVSLNEKGTHIKPIKNIELVSPKKSHPGRRNDDATVYVGNLHSSVSEELLCELMMQVGPVKDVQICVNQQPRPNYGFVEFKSGLSVVYACRVLNNLKLFRQRIGVQPTGNRKLDIDFTGDLYVNGLPPYMTESEISKVFEQFGEVEIVCKSKFNPSLAFVHMSIASDADEAVYKLHDTKFDSRDSRRLVVKISDKGYRARAAKNKLHNVSKNDILLSDTHKSTSTADRYLYNNYNNNGVGTSDTRFHSDQYNSTYNNELYNSVHPLQRYESNSFHSDIDYKPSINHYNNAYSDSSSSARFRG